MARCVQRRLSKMFRDGSAGSIILLVKRQQALRLVCIVQPDWAQSKLEHFGDMLPGILDVLAGGFQASQKCIVKSELRQFFEEFRDDEWHVWFEGFYRKALE